MGLAGFVVLGVGAVVLPNTSLDRLALSWLIPLTVAFGIAHLVAAYGLIRRRSWSSALTGYLAAIGLGVALYGLLLVLTGADPFGATSRCRRTVPGPKASGCCCGCSACGSSPPGSPSRASPPPWIGGSTAGAPRPRRGRRGLIATILGP